MLPVLLIIHAPAELLQVLDKLIAVIIRSAGVICQPLLAPQKHESSLVCEHSSRDTQIGGAHTIYI